MSVLFSDIHEDLIQCGILTDMVVLTDRLDITDNIICTTTHDIRRMIQINHKFIGHKHAIVYYFDNFWIPLQYSDIANIFAMFGKVIASGDVTFYFEKNSENEELIRNIPYIEGLMIREVKQVNDKGLWKCTWDKVNIHRTGKYAPYDKNNHMYHNFMPFTTN